MKKSTFVAMILGTIGGILFALGMCMALIPEWNAFWPGVIMGVVDAAMIKADADLMELVWNNLLSNAVKFTGRGGSIAIRQTSDETHIYVSVSDTGCGIAKESINHVFDKFYQGDTSHSTEGNGLGLALVKRVLELMDGEIQITSQEGKGSTFLVSLPVTGPEA